MRHFNEGDTVQVNAADNQKQCGFRVGKVTASRGGPTYYEYFVKGDNGNGRWFHHSVLTEVVK